MSADDQNLFSTTLRVENKDLFIDLKQNNGGKYLKISERKGKLRNTILIPVSGIKKLQAALEEVSAKTEDKKKERSNGSPPKSAGAIVPLTMATLVLSTRVFVQGLAFSTSEDSLIKHFSAAGKVQKATVLRTARRGKVLSIGLGVVEFSSESEAAKAIQTLNNSELDGRTIRCREDRDTSAEGKSEGISNDKKRNESVRVAVPTTVYVTSLAPETTDASLEKLFETAGKVVKAEVKRASSGRSIRQAIVEYADAESASAAIEHLNKQTLDGKVINVREFYE